MGADGSDKVRKYGNEFIDAYMEMVENTESPRSFHLWSAISGVSACMGRRIFLPIGDGKLFGNIYVLLVGNPAVRKGTAMNKMVSLLRETTAVRFAQDDCSGKKQGLIALMADMDEHEDPDKMNQSEREQHDAELRGLLDLTPENIGNVVIAGGPTESSLIHNDDRYAVYAAASEFNTFIGHGNIEFIEFLCKMYDCEPYDYRLKNKKEKIFVDRPYLSLIGCTTPVNISTAIPSEAIGAGFTSRVILVFGARKYKSIPRPTPSDPALMDFVKRRLSEIYFGLSGELSESRDAIEFVDSLYEKPSKLIDGRFSYYLQRRHTHLWKLGMILACSRGSTEISADDYKLADEILQVTEIDMPDALGEYGMSVQAVAKQKIMEIIRDSKEPITMDILYACMHRDISNHDLAKILNELIQAGKVVSHVSQVYNKNVYIPSSPAVVEKLEIFDLMMNAPTTERTQ